MRLGLRLGLGTSGNLSPSALKRALPATVADFDARIAGSYGGSGQFWNDLVSGNQLIRGADDAASTDDPTFTGTPGDTGAYFAFDGGDYFTGGANLNALDELLSSQRTDQSHPTTLIIGFHYPAFTSGFSVLGGTGISLSSPGWGIQLNNTNGSIIFQQFGDSSNEIRGIGASVSENTNHVLAIQFNCSTDELNYALDASTFTNVAAFVAEPATADSSVGCTIGSAPNGGARLPNGAEINHFSVYSKLLSDAELSDALDIINGR